MMFEHVSRSDELVSFESGTIYIQHGNVRVMIQIEFCGYRIRLIGSDKDPYDAANHSNGWEIVENGMQFHNMTEAKEWIREHKKSPGK